MRRTALLLTSLLLIAAADAAAQTGANSNVNRLSTGSNTNTNANTNANSNSQFLSGNNTGVNNGSLHVYSGADPYQGIVLEGSVDLPQLPGVTPAPSNFSQPYRPDTFVNTPAFLPAEMTQEEAKRCRDSKVSWFGGARPGDVPAIRLFYAAKQERPAVPPSMAHYVGTAMAVSTDGPFIAALCEAAYRAMRKGATVGVVDFAVRPKNTMFGIGYGASGGATGLPAAGAHPYAIAGTLGFGTGWSSQRVEGEVVVQLTALRYPGGAPAAVVDPAPAALAGEEHTAPRQQTDTAAPPQTDTPAVPAPDPSPARAADDTPASGPPGNAADTAPSAGATTPATPDAPAGLATSVAPAPPSTPVAYHPVDRLGSVRNGHSKRRVFDLLGTEVVKQDGRLVEVEGIRHHAAGRSERNTRLELSEVTLAEPQGGRIRYWFVFEEGRLIAWGHAGQWQATALRYRLEGLDPPGAVPLSREANARARSGP